MKYLKEETHLRRKNRAVRFRLQRRNDKAQDVELRTSQHRVDMEQLNTRCAALGAVTKAPGPAKNCCGPKILFGCPTATPAFGSSPLKACFDLQAVRYNLVNTPVPSYASEVTRTIFPRHASTAQAGKSAARSGNRSPESSSSQTRET
jgi:hypothetical protein